MLCLHLLIVGERSGNSSRVAEYIPGSGMGHLQQHLDASTNVVAKAKMVSCLLFPFSIYSGAIKD